MSSIPDPIELMEMRIEHECDMVDAKGMYPCCKCGTRYSLEHHDWICMLPVGDGPLMCTDCSMEESRDE